MARNLKGNDTGFDKRLYQVYTFPLIYLSISCFLIKFKCNLFVNLELQKFSIYMFNNTEDIIKK